MATKITFVKKIKLDGSPCAKCADVQAQLEKNQQMRFISEVVIADERDLQSIGMLLAKKYNVDRAPFFIVEMEDGEVRIYTIYLKFVREILNQSTNTKEEMKDILDSNPDLDFI